MFYSQVLTALDELLKNLDTVKNEINAAEQISTNPETLAAQLQDDHRAFHANLERKTDAAIATTDERNRMLRETTNAKADGSKNKLDTIWNQVE